MSDKTEGEERARRGVALRGNLTEGPIVRTLVVFSIPTMIANLLQTMGGTINTIWVGQLLGEGALAATANANIVTFLAFAFVFGFGMAATVRVGQHFGAGDLDAARRVFGTGTGFCLAIALAGAVLGWAFSSQLLHILSTPPSVHDQALDYIRVSFLSIPINTVGMMISMGMRGAGDARTPFYAMIVSTVLGIVLNPVLILGWGPIPAMGIGGSALAAAIGGLGSAILLIFLAYHRNLPLRLRGPELRYLIPMKEELNYIMGKGLPQGAQMLINSSAGVIMIGLVNREGMLTTAAYGAVQQIWNYIQMPSFAISMGVSAMVAQNIGASQYHRVAAINRAGIVLNTLVTTVLTCLLLIFDGPLLSLFLGHGSQAIAIAEHVQLLSTWAWILSGVAMILMGTLRSYGVVIAPLVIMVIAQYAARIGFYFVLHPFLGADALWWSFPASTFVSMGLTWLVYSYGGWRKTCGPDAPAGSLPR